MSSRANRLPDRGLEVPGSPLPSLGTGAIESGFAAGRALGHFENLMPRDADCWTRSWPSLDAFISANPVVATPARICIATNDIVGPTRNGGIGTTYAALADLLAGMSLDVTILYLKGSDIENATLDHWIDHYAARKITFVPLPNQAAADALETDGENCLSTSYNLLHFLRRHPMDVVHVSEWRGAGFLPLLYKRQGLGFRETTFIVKASSPWLWDRLYGMQPLHHAADLVQVHAERQSIELADLVVSGSTHLLRFMASQGYKLPASKTFVQPNVVQFDGRAPLKAPEHSRAEGRHAIEEFVFFGRLESRKGLAEFIDAVSRMVRQGGPLPSAVTFLGKPGVSLPERPDASVVDYIQQATMHWPMPVNMLTTMGQAEAVEYLTGGPRLAVMPSKIENSSLALYEAAISGVPFVASNVGGNPEIVDVRDHAEAFVEPQVLPLADRLSAILRDGAIAPRPAFANDDNLEIWRESHRRIPLLQNTPTVDVRSAISVAIYAESITAVAATLEDLDSQSVRPNHVVIGVADTGREAIAAATSLIAKHPNFSCVVVDVTDFGLGKAFNTMIGGMSADYVLCVEAGTRLTPDAIAIIANVGTTTSTDIFTMFCRQAEGDGTGSRFVLRPNLRQSAGLTFFSDTMSFIPFALRRSAFARGLTLATDTESAGIAQEFFGRALVEGYSSTTIPVELAGIPPPSTLRGSGSTRGEMVAARPYLAALPLAVRDVLMRAQGLDGRKHSARKSLQLIGRFAGSNGSAPAPRAEASACSAHLKHAHAMGAPLQPLGHVRQIMNALDEADQQRRYTGALLYSTPTEIVGWIRDETAADTRVKIEARVVGKAVARAETGQRIAGHIPLRSDIAGHVFRLHVPGKSRWREPVDIFIASGGEPWRTVRAGRAGQPTFEGWCDWADPQRIDGWAWYPENPDARIDVAIFVDGNFYARVTADGHRRDLFDAGIGFGDYAFSVALPPLKTTPRGHLLEVAIADTGVRLGNGAMLLRDGKWKRSWHHYAAKLGLRP